MTGTPALLSIAVTPANPSLGQGSNQLFAATGTYTDSSTKDVTASVVWGSSDTSVAVITASGLATAAGAGVSTISATSGLVSGSTLLNSTVGGLITCSARPVDMRVLVVANDGTEVEFPRSNRSWTTSERLIP